MEYQERYIEKIPQSILMDDAKDSLIGKWGLGAVTYLVYILVAGAGGIIPFGSIIIAGPMALGLAIFGLNLSRDRDANTSNIFDGFNNFGTALVAYLLMVIAVIIGFFCLIVPGIILSLGFSQTFFIIADEPDISPVDALKKSWEMMKGNKGDFFILGLRFIPWMILCIFTLFIGFLWLGPYMQVTFAKFYESIRFEEDIEEDKDDYSKHLVDG